MGNMLQEHVTIDLGGTLGAQNIPLPEYMSAHDLKLLRSTAGHPIGKIRCNGEDNLLLIGEHTTIRGLHIDIKGRKNRIIIGSHCAIKLNIKIIGVGITVFVGAHTTIGGGTIFTKKRGNVYIGKQCMFSTEIDIRTSDSHSIIDLNEMKTVNPSQSIFIGDHVWIGKGAVISKGATIADDNIVGLGAYVRGSFSESSTTIVGAPARVVRRDCTWSRKDNVDPEKVNIYSWRDTPLL